MVSPVRIPRIGIRSTLTIFLASVLLLLALAALIYVGSSGGIHGTKPHPAKRQLVVPATKLPEVEPIVLQAIAPADARAVNAAVPFSTLPNPAARPFNFPGGDEDRLRAVDCLASAVIYEAGDDAIGQQAVAQVILNRVRHPAFPKTVCGVVFQGSERSTGCQFTFTCDGALNRSYSTPAWERARSVAKAALSGSVYKPVGHATHYHTDWVVPYWSSSLDKIVAVHTHLFFRWTGWWGTPPAFRFSATGVEPHISKLAGRFPEHDVLGAQSTELVSEPVPTTGIGSTTQSSFDDSNVFLAVLAKKDADQFPAIARRACGARPYCKFRGWTDASKVPSDKSADLRPDQLDAISFSFLRDPAISFERVLWNCAQFKHPAENCMWNASAGLRPRPAPSVQSSGQPSKGPG